MQQVFSDELSLCHAWAPAMGCDTSCSSWASWNHRKLNVRSCLTVKKTGYSRWMILKHAMQTCFADQESRILCAKDNLCLLLKSFGNHVHRCKDPRKRLNGDDNDHANSKAKHTAHPFHQSSMYQHTDKLHNSFVKCSTI